MTRRVFTFGADGALRKWIEDEVHRHRTNKAVFLRGVVEEAYKASIDYQRIHGIAAKEAPAVPEPPEEEQTSPSLLESEEDDFWNTPIEWGD